MMYRFFSQPGAVFGVTAAFSAGSALLLASALLPPSAQAQPRHDVTVVHHDGDHRRTTVVVDRGRPGWWHGAPGFEAYHGVRAGYYFAPGYGYYPVPHAYVGRAFVVGMTVPVAMRTYVVINPALYGLGPVPAGFRWYYAGTSFVLASAQTGVIVRSVAGGW